MSETRYQVQFFNPVNDVLVREQYLTYVPMVNDEFETEDRLYIVRSRRYVAKDLRWVLQVYPLY